MRRRRSLQNPNKVAKKATTLSDIMRISMIVHKDGLIWLFHDKPFPDELDYVEFDLDEDKIYCIGKLGVPMDLGLKIKKNLYDPLMQCDFIMTAHVEKEDVKNLKLVSFVTRKIKEDEDESEKNKKSRKNS